jgi:hypothetical protein
MPAAEELPAEISNLAYRNAFELSHSRWESDVREMIRRLNLDVSEQGGPANADRSKLQEKRTTAEIPVAKTTQQAGASKPPLIYAEWLTRRGLLMTTAATLTTGVLGGGAYWFLNSEQKEGPARTVVERSLSRDQLQTIQANLCVVPTGNFDNDTRGAIQQAKIGAVQSRRAVSASAPFNNTEDEIKSPIEAQIFLDVRSCSKDPSGAERAYLTAFEKFRFPDQVAINALQSQLNACDRNLNLKASESFDQPTRTAIAYFKAQAPNTERAKFGDPSSGKLDDKSYGYITRTCFPPSGR